MKTTIDYVKTTNKIIDNTNDALLLGVKTANETIKATAAKTDWILKDESFIDEDYLKFNISRLSINQRKKLKNKFNAVILKKSMKSMNSFMYWVHKRVLRMTTPAPWFSVSERELSIRAARKAYVNSRNATIKLYEAYKTIKGDYYK